MLLDTGRMNSGWKSFGDARQHPRRAELSYLAETYLRHDCQSEVVLTVETQMNNLEDAESTISQLLSAQHLAQPKLTVEVFPWAGQRILRTKS